MRVLVTGSAGFLGGASMAALEGAGHTVFGLDLADVDIADATQFRSALQRLSPEAVVHIAALLTPQCAADPARAAEVNCVGSAVVMASALAAGVQNLVYASSVAAINPRSVYGATKAFAEHLGTALQAAHPSAGVTGLRFGWIYGSGRQRGWNEVMEVVRAYALGEKEVSFPDFAEPIDWTHVDDAAGAVLAVLHGQRAGARVYDVVGDARTMSEAIAHLARRFPQVVAVARPATTPPTDWAALDGAKLAAEIGFRCTIGMEEGLDRTVAAIRQGSGIWSPA